MTFGGWILISVIILCLGLLVTTSFSADVVFLGGLTILIISKVVSPQEALVGFSNQGMLTVGALYIVAAGLKETGAIQLVVSRIIGRSKNIRRAQVRVMAPVMVVSAFLNNTPVVASFIPALEDWARKNRIPASKLLIPLSYAAILGGTCTLIGTSTNLIVNGLVIAETSTRAIGIFEPGLIGLPCAIAGFLYMVAFGRKLLPIRGSGFDTFKDPREYTIEMIVDKDSPLAQQSVEEAGLLSLPGLFMVEVNRDEQIITPIDENLVLKGDDRIIFAGILESIIDLKQIKGLRAATNQIFKLDSSKRERLLFEAVISQSNPLVGTTIRKGKFRNRYNGVILAVSRNGERVKKRVGDIVLKTGDTLLIEAHSNFLEQFKNSSDFYLISSIASALEPNYSKSWIAWSVLGLMVITAATGIFSMFQASFMAAGLMVLTGCLAPASVKKSIDWTVLLVIGATLGIGNAMEVTGTAVHLASGMMGFLASNPHLALAGIYVATWVLTELVTNNAAAVLIFPIALSVASSLGVSYMPFIFVIIMAASASFSTPIGYQTNLMVYGPGGYHFTDFTKIGLPLNLLVAALTLLLVPIIWPF